MLADLMIACISLVRRDAEPAQLKGGDGRRPQGPRVRLIKY